MMKRQFVFDRYTIKVFSIIYIYRPTANGINSVAPIATVTSIRVDFSFLNSRIISFCVNHFVCDTLTKTEQMYVYFLFIIMAYFFLAKLLSIFLFRLFKYPKTYIYVYYKFDSSGTGLVPW